MSDLKYEALRRVEMIKLWIVWKLPRWVVYWASIRLMSAATVGKYSGQNVPELLVVDALKRWEANDAED